ncbi:MAG: SagB/ThcOx family dehydrogenase [Bacteroidales bacterium]|nr:SagB/ThcOx family dehydrogenase [Bacteroidales bacterium]
MKRISLLLTLGVIMATGINAQEKKIGLPSPDMERQGNVMKALQDRKSTREFSSGLLSLQDLGDLVWAACGINRQDGRRTAGSALNKQDCELYVIMETGAYLYDAKGNCLVLVKEGDWRGAVAGKQKFVLEAPVSLVIVSDYSKMGDVSDSHTKTMCAVDAGIISQNISIFCASAGMATVARASMDEDALRKALELSPAQHPLINHPVGYFR